MGRHEKDEEDEAWKSVQKLDNYRPILKSPRDLSPPGIPPGSGSVVEFVEREEDHSPGREEKKQDAVEEGEGNGSEGQTADTLETRPQVEMDERVDHTPT